MELERNDIKKSLRENKVTKLDKKTVVKLRNEIEEKLNVISKIYGIKIELGRIKFDDLGFKSSLRAQLESYENSHVGLQVSGEQAAFERACWRYHIDKSHYNAEVTFLRGKFRGLKGNIVAFNHRAKKYPVVIRLQNGKGDIRTSIASVRSMLGLG